MEIKIKKINDKWEYNEEKVLNHLKKNADKYSSFSDFCKQLNVYNSNFQKVFSKKYKKILETLNWSYDKNNINFKTLYQDYDWLYDKYITKGMSIDEIVKISNCKKRTIKKWLVEKHRLTNEFRLSVVQLNKKQKDLIIGSLLGDGHIDKRKDYPLFIISHAENQKDYLYWKYDILKNICNKPPTKIPELIKIFNDKEYISKKLYRICTRSYKSLFEFQNLEKSNIIKKLNDFSLSIWFLDDGHYSGINWTLCYADISDDDRKLVINILEERFGIKCNILKDNRYISFNKKNSNKINEIILKNIPNHLDIIQYKMGDYINGK